MKKGISTVLVLTICSILIVGCRDKEKNDQGHITLESGLQYEILKTGTGETVKEGDEVIVHERMGYRDGTELYTTDGSENLPKFLVGGNQAVEGVDQGVRGMQTGEIRKLIVPPSLSKRKQYPDFLSPDSTLVNEIEIVEIIKPVKEDLINKKILSDGRKSGFEMVLVEGGNFMMGGDDHVDDGGPMELRIADECPHPVTVNDFHIGKYEVTQKDWMEIMGENPSKSKDCEDCPVDQVSWYDIQEFIEKVNDKYGESLRLPSEEEWEFAARGGSKSEGYLYAGSDDVGEVAWYADNSGGRPHPVGMLKPNELGIYDMSGNIWEWCSNAKIPYPCDEIGKVFESKVLRGGTFGNRATSIRVRDRNGRDPSMRLSTLGFRLAK
ncbi:SUMF1/EgtB/PvdO family nonheme iron enzyme [Ulvibacterium sp.]|uniref:SUMF1/EgtB/PvdO family nonheme iron enzyme n=1 Tax=Ulvibacterium sp. TaxID=2665914 RepID=UPI003BA9FEBA